MREVGGKVGGGSLALGLATVQMCVPVSYLYIVCSVKHITALGILAPGCNSSCYYDKRYLSMVIICVNP